MLSVWVEIWVDVVGTLRVAVTLETEMLVLTVIDVVVSVLVVS